jgi:hypothetical protein
LKKSLANAPKESYIYAKQVWRTWVKVKIVQIFFTFLLITFIWCIFQNFFYGFEIRWNSAFFIPILSFWIKFFYSSY